MSDAAARIHELARAPALLDASRYVDAETEVGPMYLHRDDEVITPTIVKTGCWEPEEAAFLRGALRPGASFVDVGANVGYFSLLAADIVGAAGSVLAVEPEADNLHLLRANLWRNRAWNARVLPVAAGARTEYVGLRLSPANRGDHQVLDAAGHLGPLVPSLRLDELIGEGHVDVIKVDTQGVDHDVVEGLAGCIARNPAVVLMCEFWLEGMDSRGVDPRAVLEGYERLGLKLALLVEGGAARPATADEILDATRSHPNGFVNVVLTPDPQRLAELAPREAAPSSSAEEDLGPVYYAGWERVIPDRSLWPGPKDPIAHFLRWPFEYRAYLTLLCGLKHDDRVLELGCNHGRTMLGLLDYLRPPGGYDGLDILPAQIEYAQSHIEALAPHFRFQLADIYNDAYNPGGRLDAADYRFPYEDGAFNCAYAASLFTHLLPDAVANYLRETRRVLKPGARSLYSFFILDFYAGSGTSAHPLYEFDGRLPGVEGVGVRDVEHPAAVIAYARDALERMAADARLRVVDVLPGYWSAQGDYAVNEQDLVLLEAV